MFEDNFDKSIPAPAVELVRHYFNLQLGGKTLTAPYFRNVKHARAELRSIVGKGTPEELKDEVLIFAKLKGFPLKEKSPDEIRAFMSEQGLGIDCSGFIAHIFDTWLKAAGKRSLILGLKFPKSSLYRSLIRILRPIENINVEVLTGPLNADPVALKDVRAGDLIRLKGIKHGDHVVLITNVIRDQESNLAKIVYVQSSPYYGNQNGVKFGEIEITDPAKELKDQKWNEVDEKGVCWTLQQLIKESDDNGLRRPKFLKPK
jgi:hypothetical protein